MKIRALIFILLFLGLAGTTAYYSFAREKTVSFAQAEIPPMVGVSPIIQERPSVEPTLVQRVSTINAPGFVNPIDYASERMTKKHFGTYVSPDHSLVPNEHFKGLHAAVDFEILDDREIASEVEIRTVCQGPLVRKEWAKGYGGVVVQECILNDNPISIIYGHMDIASIVAEKGDIMMPGDRLGNLGDGYSHETDGARKHLHLGFYNGVPADIRGYVPTQEELVKYLNPCHYICQ
ncbi:MAG: peptidoglycan DD-metalloendopeptidase family protein [Patescibacteria group bacterium]